MTEPQAITKYTLVPVTMVLAAVVLTTAATNYLWADKTTMALLKSENLSLRREFETHRRWTKDTFNRNGRIINRMDLAVQLIAQKLEVRLPPDQDSNVVTGR